MKKFLVLRQSASVHMGLCLQLYIKQTFHTPRKIHIIFRYVNYAKIISRYCLQWSERDCDGYALWKVPGIIAGWYCSMLRSIHYYTLDTLLSWSVKSFFKYFNTEIFNIFTKNAVPTNIMFLKKDKKFL